MKKLLVAIFMTAIIYFALAAVLVIAKVCPEYIDLMPQLERSDNTTLPLLFCPFSKRVY